MGCYLGCASRGNKIKWALAVLLALLALAFIVACAVTSYPCQDNAEQLRDEGGINTADGEYYSCTDSLDRLFVSECLKELPVCQVQLAMGVAFILAALLMLLPLFAMCCCSRKPAAKQPASPSTHQAAKVPAETHVSYPGSATPDAKPYHEDKVQRDEDFANSAHFVVDPYADTHGVDTQQQQYGSYGTRPWYDGAYDSRTAGYAGGTTAAGYTGAAATGQAHASPQVSGAAESLPPPDTTYMHDAYRVPSKRGPPTIIGSTRQVSAAESAMPDAYDAGHTVAPSEWSQSADMDRVYSQAQSEGRTQRNPDVTDVAGQSDSVAGASDTVGDFPPPAGPEAKSRSTWHTPFGSIVSGPWKRSTVPGNSQGQSSGAAKTLPPRQY